MRQAQRASRRRCVVYLAVVVFAVFLVAGLLHSFFANDPSLLSRVAAERTFTKFHQLGATTSQAYAARLLHEVDDYLVSRGAPLPSAVDVSQFVFVSCNRHDQDQDYWRLMANVAQCESASWAQRAQSSQCFALYSGIRDGPEAGRGLTVPQGACGAVLPPTSIAASGASEGPFVQPVDALAWLGDAIYADKREGGSPSMPFRSHADNPLQTVERFWITQRRSSPYTNYRHTCVRRKPGAAGEGPIPLPVDQPSGVAPLDSHIKEDFKLPASAPDVFAVYGTWDDHDMGENDGGADYPYRNTTQRFLLNFIGAEASDARWKREGVYDFRVVPFRETIITGVDTRSAEDVTLIQEAYGALQSVYENAICAVLLDSRSFRDPPNATEAGDMLGRAQWDWLEQTLLHRVSDKGLGPHEKRRCALTLVGTGIQLLFDEKPGENWGAFPRSRDKLFGMLKQHGVERVAFLTGDIHMGEIALDASYHAVHHILGYPIIEITSSGLTHSAGDFKGLATLFPTLFPTPRRVGIYMERNFASIRLLFDTARLKAFVRPLLQEYWPSSQLPHVHMDGAGVVRGNGHDPNAAPVSLTALQHALESALNVSFTSYAVTLHGQPVVRLNLPLEAMTTRRGPQYAAAGMRVVQPDATGYLAPFAKPLASVVVPPQRPSRFGVTAFQTNALGRTVAAHYPNSFPQPFITWLVRTAQYSLFPDRTISQTLVAIIKRVIFMCTLCTLVGLWYTYRVTQRRRRRQRLGFARPPGVAASAVPPAAPFGSAAPHKRRSELHLASTEQEDRLGSSAHLHLHGPGTSTSEMTPLSGGSPGSAVTPQGGTPTGATSVSISGTAGALYDLLRRETKQKRV